jgi:Histidine kinase
MASRARIVAAADETRRQIGRDLHEGTQQQLVSLILDLRQVQAAVPPEQQAEDAEMAQLVSITLLPRAGRVVVPDLFIRPAHDGVQDVAPGCHTYNLKEA